LVFEIIYNPCEEIRNAAKVIFAANIIFHGVLGCGYGTLKLSKLYLPLIIFWVIKEFQILKLYMNSYKAITIIASITNCNIDLIGGVIVFILSLPSLVIQNHDSTDAIIRYVTSFGDP
jgi:hypothetical protein